MHLDPAPPQTPPDPLNREQTLALQAQPRYRRLLDWGLSNGLLLEGVQFPACFGQPPYTGLAAKQDIPQRKVFMAVPYKLIITLDTVLSDADLLTIIKEHPKVLGIKSDPDNEFNMLSLFILCQKLKGADSFYEPYISSLPLADFTASQWPDQLFRAAQALCLAQQRNYLQNSLTQTFQYIFEKIFTKYQQFTKLGFSRQQFRQVYFWSVGIVMTRSYGWSLPSTCLVPFADLCNHSAQDSTTHFLVSTGIEQGKKQHHPQYRIKKGFLDLRLLSPASFKPPVRPVNSKLKKFIYCNKLQFLEDILSDRQIVDAKIFQKVERGIVDLTKLTFLTSSCDEDNDTDQDEQEQYNKVVTDMRAHQLQVIAGYNKEVKEQDEGFYPNPMHPEYKRPDLPKDAQGQTLQQNLFDDKLSDQSDYEWLKEDSQSVYFSLSTQRAIKKGEQLFNCYGKRSNRFLLMWYGFALSRNHYDSCSFRLWMDYMQESKSLEEMPAEILYFGWYLGLAGKTTTQFRGRTCLVKQLSREIRLKEQRICLDLITFLRVFLLAYWKASPASHKPLALFPTSYSYELFMLKFYRTILKHLQQRQPPLLLILPEDPPHIKAKKNFLNRLIQSNQRILSSQMSINGFAMQLILLLNNKQPLHKAASSLGSSKKENIRILRALRPYVSNLAEAGPLKD